MNTSPSPSFPQPRCGISHTLKSLLQALFTLTILVATSGTLSAQRTDFTWGMAGNPIWKWPYTQASATSQINDVKALGMTYYRIDLGVDYNGIPNQSTGTALSAEQVFLNLCTSAADNGLKLLVMLYPNYDQYQGESANYSLGYNMGKNFVNRFKGNSKFSAAVRYIEVGNELDVVTLLGGDGCTVEQYDQVLGGKIGMNITGMSDGIHDAGTGIKTIVNYAGWLHYGWLKFLFWTRNFYSFDIISLHWYSRFGDMNNVSWTGSAYGGWYHSHTNENVLNTLANSFGKDLWITEINAWPGDDKAYWLNRFASQAYGHSRVKAFQVYELYESPSEPGFGIYSSPGVKTGAWQPLYNIIASYGGASSSATKPGGSTYYRLRNEWKGTYLYHASGQGVNYGSPAVSDQRSHWQFIQLSDGTYNIKNRADGTYMNVENNYSWVECYAINPAWGTPRWLVTNAPSSGYKLIKNSWRAGEKIHVENQLGYAQHGTNIPDTWSSPHWKMEPVN